MPQKTSGSGAEPQNVGSDLVRAYCHPSNNLNTSPSFIEIRLMAELERITVLKTLKTEKWNQASATARLARTRRQLRAKMEKYQLL